MTLTVIRAIAKVKLSMLVFEKEIMQAKNSSTCNHMSTLKAFYLQASVLVLQNAEKIFFYKVICMAIICVFYHLPLSCRQGWP